MAFDVSGLPAYVNQTENKDRFLHAALFGSKSKTLATTYQGIKGSQTINIMAESAAYQADGCEITASGDSTITQRTITVGAVVDKKKYCLKDLIPKWTQHLLKQGSEAENDQIALMDFFANYGVAQIAKQEETNAWQGDTGSGTANLNKYDGWLAITDAATTAGTITAGAFVTGVEYTIVSVGTTDFTLIGASANTVGVTFTATGAGTGTGTALDVAASPINGNPTAIATATGITTANVISIIDGIYSLIPADILDKADKFVAVGADVFRTYMIALKQANLFHFAPNDTNMEFVLPGTDITLYGLNGLNGTNRIVASYWENMIYGTDLTNDEEQYKWVYDEVDEVWYRTIRFKSGYQIGFPSEVVQFTLA